MGKLIANPYTGYFIDFEGCDGSGKTTQVNLLVKTLKKEDYPVLHTYEPTKDYRFGKLVRSIYTSADVATTLPESLKYFFADEGYYVCRRHVEKVQKKYLVLFEKIADDLMQGNHNELPHFIQLCMTFDRYDHRTRIELPALKEGTHVISDRDLLSTLAYGMSENIPFHVLLQMQKNILKEAAIMPDLIIFLDIPVEVAAKRMAESHRSKEHFDDKLTQVSRAYHEITLNSEINRLSTIVSIDGSLSPETVHHFIMSSVQKMLRHSETA